MRVAHITYHYMPIVGGQEVYIKNLIDILKKEGIQNDVYQPVNKNYHYFSKNKDNDVKLVFYLPMLGRFIHGSGKYLFNIFLLMHYFAFFKYDRIIVHYAFHSLPFWFFKKKVIVLSHGVEWYPNSNGLNDRVSHYIALKALNRFVTVANDTNYYRTLNLNITPAKNYFKKIGRNNWFIPNCVNSKYFIRTEGINELKKRNVVLVPRQITVDRGIHLAIDAFAIFDKQYENYFLYIVGTPTCGKYYEKCKDLINKYKLDDRIIFTGLIKNEIMRDYYSSAKLTLIPTLRREGTSLSALESMACGCPVVSTNVAGLADLPTLQADADAESLSNKMYELINNYEQIKADQKEIVGALFNLQNWEDAWMRVINSKLLKAKI